MTIDEALSDVGVLCIESAPFIYYTESRAGYIEKMRSIFTYLLDERLAVVTSTITLSECLTKPLKEGSDTLIGAYNTLFERTQGIQLIPVSAAVARRSADLRARYQLRTPDAIHVATALEAGCDAFLTNDLGIKRINDVRVLILDELSPTTK